MTNIQRIYLNRAKFVAHILLLAPFVRAVFLTGSLARGEATKDSDIDFFIVTKKNRLFTGRLFITILVQMTGLRRYGNKIAGRICLNRYQTENHLIVYPQNAKNIIDYIHLTPLWQENHIYERYKYQNNWIIKRFRGKFVTPNNQKSNMIIFLPLMVIRFVFEVIFEVIFNDWGEEVLANYQKRRILADSRTKNASDDSIFVSDSELRFHPAKK